MKVNAFASPSETQVVDLVCRMLPLQFGHSCLTAVEVRSHGTARTDIVVLLGAEVIGIEVKVAAWKRGLAQAAFNRFCVDRSYIALWTAGEIKETIIAEASRLGVGVIAVSEATIRVVLDAPLASPTPCIRRRMSERVLSGSAY